MIRAHLYIRGCLNMMQVYIVTGGITNNFERSLQETETLLKDVGTAWKKAANLPTGRCCFSGVGFANGNFIVAGKNLNKSVPMEHNYNTIHRRGKLQVQNHI